jgi:DNA-binding PadR family transcriptional regulator
MSLKHGILGLLSLRPMAGYDLMKAFNTSLKHFWSAQSSQIYRELDALVAEGWIKADEVLQRGRSTKTIFAVTDEGSKEFDRWLRQGKLERGGSRNPFLLRLFFLSGAGIGAVRAAVEEKASLAEAGAAELRAIVSDVIPRIAASVGDELAAMCWKEAAEYGIAQYEAEIRWAETFLARIGALKGEIG